MGFYGNIGNTTKTQFSFDKVYSNRADMVDHAATDGIFIGRYVLVDYDQNIDSENYPHYYLYEITNSNHITYYYISNSKLSSVSSPINSNYAVKNLKSQCILIDANCHIYYKDNAIQSNTNASQEFFRVSTDSTGCVINETGTVFTGVLEDYYNETDNYSINFNIDKARFKMGRGYDSTVWQKIKSSDDSIVYISIADLNSVVPTFDITYDPPTVAPITPHFDQDSTNVYYKLHWQPQWGFRVKPANAIRIPQIDPNSGNILYLEDYVAASSDTTTAVDSDQKIACTNRFYDKGSGTLSDPYYLTESSISGNNNANWSTSYATIDGAIYFNKKGFDPEVRSYIDTAKKPDQIKIEPTGRSGMLYHMNHGDFTSNTYAATEDVFELSVCLPSLGNAISDVWDKVYGENRNLNAAWENPIDGVGKAGNRLYTLVNTDGSDSWNLTPSGVECLTGCINSVHDLMGMILCPNAGTDTNKNTYTSVEELNEDNPIWRDALNSNYIYLLTENNKVGYYMKRKTYTFDSDINPTEDKKIDGKWIAYKQADFTDESNLYKAENPISFTLFDFVKPDEYKDTETYFKLDPTQIITSITFDGDYARNIFYHNVSTDYNQLKFKKETSETLSQYCNLQNLENKEKLYKIDKSEKSLIPLSSLKGKGKDGSRTSLVIYVPGIFYQLDSSGNYTICEDDEVSLKDVNFYLPKGQESISGESSIYYYITYIPVSVPNQEDFNLHRYYIKNSGETEYLLVGPDTDYTTFDDTQDYFYQSITQASAKEGTIIGSTLKFNTYRNSICSWTKNTFFIEDGDYFKAMTKDDVLQLYEDAGGIQPDFSKVYVYSNGYTAEEFQTEYIDKVAFARKSETSIANSAWTPCAILDITDSNYTTFNDNKFVTLINNLYYPNYYHYIEASTTSSENNYRVYNRTEDTKDEDFSIVYIPTAAFDKLENVEAYKNNKYYTLKTENGIDIYTLYNEPYSGAHNNQILYEQVNYYVVSDSQEDRFETGMVWPPTATIPDGVIISTVTDTYSLYRLNGFADDLNTIHGLILQLNRILNLDNTLTRDRTTVQGSINYINDIINRFGEMEALNPLVVNRYGQVASAEFSSNEWILPKITTDNNFVINHKEYGNTLSTKNTYISFITASNNKFNINALTIDNAGHISAHVTNTLTMPTINIATNATGKVVTSLAGAEALTSNGYQYTVTPSVADIGTLPLTGYSIATSAASISATDTLNTGLGKLEKKIDQEISDRQNLDVDLIGTTTIGDNHFLKTIQQVDGKIEVTTGDVNFKGLKYEQKGETATSTTKFINTIKEENGIIEATLADIDFTDLTVIQVGDSIPEGKEKVTTTFINTIKEDSGKITATTAAVDFSGLANEIGAALEEGKTSTTTFINTIKQTNGKIEATTAEVDFEGLKLEQVGTDLEEGKTTATTFIHTIKQDKGVVYATTANLPTSLLSQDETSKNWSITLGENTLNLISNDYNYSETYNGAAEKDEDKATITTIQNESIFALSAKIAELSTRLQTAEKEIYDLKNPTTT